MRRVEYALFLKAAVAGEVETRLVPQLGPEGACALYRHLREHALAPFTDARARDLALWVSPAADEEMAGWAARSGWRAHRQVGVDLGARMG